jgi:hypothetical protein
MNCYILFIHDFLYCEQHQDQRMIKKKCALLAKSSMCPFTCSYSVFLKDL